MPIGKDSIQKRVAKATETAPAEELKVEAAEMPAAPRKRTTSTATKSTSTGTKKTTSTGTKKTTTAKKPATKADAPKVESPAVEAPVSKPTVDTAVLANVSPETVAAVIGHDEKKPSDKVKIGQKMPTYLL